MTRCKKNGKRRVSTFKFLSEAISRDVEDIFLALSATPKECSCGCSRPIKSILSIASQKYFCSKNRWLKLLGIRRSRIRELTEVSEVVLGTVFSDDLFNDLDLNLVKSDISRQQWMTTEDQVALAERSIYTFCLYNNVAYWQGIHDVAAALVHLDPTPTVGELSALIERLVKSYAPILFSPNPNEVAAEANDLSLKWRLLFKYFFPKASHDYDRFCESSFSIGWFMTLGFYRFGCAYISLAYTFLMIISRYDPLSSFMFRELGYIAARGYINYLNRQRVSVDFNNSVIFSNFSNASLIVNTLVNSNKIVLESEEFINISKNLYDTFNGRDFELAEFPLLYIFNSANILLGSAPSVFGIDASKEFVEISESDIFSRRKRITLFESQLKPNASDSCFLIRYRGNRALGSLHKKRRAFSFTHRTQETNIADAIGFEIAYSYISSFKRFGQLSRHSANFGMSQAQRSDFVFGNVMNTNVTYTIVDLRSQYLRSGMALENIFGTSHTTFVKDIVATDVFESAFLDTNFTLWIVLTDEGYEAGDNQDAMVSLNRGLEVMDNLSRNSITCVTLFRGGYKGLLRSIKAPIPQPPSLLSRISVRRLWEGSQPSDFSPGRNLASFATSISTAAVGIENRIVQGISDMRLFSMFRGPQASASGGLADKVQGRALSISLLPFVTYSTEKLNAILYKLTLSTPAGLQISIRSNARVKINGQSLDPLEYPNAVLDLNLDILVSASTLFSVNCVDGVLDLEPLSYCEHKRNTSLVEFFNTRRDDALERFVLVLTPLGTPISVPFWHHLELSTTLLGVLSGTRITGFSKHWNFYMLKRKRLVTHLIDCDISPPQMPPKPEILPGGSCSEDSVETSDPSDLSNISQVTYVGSVRQAPLPHEAKGVKNLKVFSRTNEYRPSVPMVSRLVPSDSVESRVSSIPTPTRRVSIVYNNNVFISRSTLNRRQGSK